LRLPEDHGWNIFRREPNDGRDDFEGYDNPIRSLPSSRAPSGQGLEPPF
jgi:hypothetical protein